MDLMIPCQMTDFIINNHLQPFVIIAILLVPVASLLYFGRINPRQIKPYYRESEAPMEYDPIRTAKLTSEKE